MFGLILVTIVGFLTFTFITIFCFSKISKMNEYDGIKYAREKLKMLANLVLKAIGTEIITVYEDEEDFRALDSGKGVVFISNHASNFDIPVLTIAIPLDIGFVAKKEMESWIFYGKWMKASGTVFLERKNPRKGIEGINKAIEIIKKGHPLVIFPQGKRKASFGKEEFKKGSFKLAISSEGIIVPIVLKGTSKIQASRGKMVYFNKKVTVHIGKSIKTKELSKEELKNLNVVVEEKIRLIFNKN
ncbi:MAG: lysophospholipid acyltransferase family protein [Fusobacteriaceae bacterium]